MTERHSPMPERDRLEENSYSERMTKEDLIEKLQENKGDYIVDDNIPWTALIKNDVQEIKFKSVNNVEDALFDYEDYSSPETGFLVRVDEDDVLIIPVARKGNLGGLGKQTRPDFYGWKISYVDKNLLEKLDGLADEKVSLGKMQEIDESLVQEDRRKSNRHNASFNSPNRSNSAPFDKIIF